MKTRSQSRAAAAAPLAMVTGGSGFVGRRLVEMLMERGWRCRVFDRVQTWEHPEVELCLGDLTKADEVDTACKGVDAVFHVASIISLSDRIPRSVIYAVNVEGTRHLIDSCCKHGVQKLVYTSTASVLYVGKDLKNADETTEMPETFPFTYAETKAIAEQEVLAANGRENGTPSGLLTAAIRPHSIYGPRDAIAWPNIIAKALQGKFKFVLGKGDNLSDYTYVDNCCYGHILAAEQLQSPEETPAGQVYHIHDGQARKQWEVFRDIAVGMGVDPKTVGKFHIPASVAYFLGWANETVHWLKGCCFKQSGEGPVMTRFTVLNATTHHYYNIEKARRELGYEPLVSHDDAMQITLDWFKENYEGDSKSK